MIFDKVKSIIADQLDVEEDKITQSSNIQDDLGADSLDVADILNTMEEKLHITITDEEAAELKTIRDAANFLEKKLNK